MPKLVYIYGDDHKCLETLISSMRSNGSSLEYTSLPDEPAAGAIRADIVLICKPADSTTRYEFGGLTLDLDNICAYDRSQHEIHFTPTEFSLLSYLMRNAARAVSRKELLPAVWGFQDDSTTRVADDTVKRLRKKLAGSGVGIETIWGYGFKLREMPATGSAV